MPDGDKPSNLPHETVIPISDELAQHLQAESTTVSSANVPAESPAAPVGSEPAAQNVVMPILESPTQATDTPQMTSEPVATMPQSEQPAASFPEAPASPAPPDSSDGLTAEQQKFINGAAWGPLMAWIYYFCMKIWWLGVLFIVLPVIMQMIQVSRLTNIAGPNASMEATVTGQLWILAGYGIMLLVLIGLLIYGVLRGRRLAWKHRRWESFEAFRIVQQEWDRAAKITVLVTVIMIVAVITVVVIFMAALFKGLSPLSSTSTSGSMLTDRMAEAADAQTKSDVGLVATALESCFTQNRGTYTGCGSVSQLQQQHYLKATVAEVTVSTNDTSAIVYGQLSGGAICNSGSGSQKFYVYNSNTGESSTICANEPPKVDDSGMGNMGGVPMATSTPAPTLMPL